MRMRRNLVMAVTTTLAFASSAGAQGYFGKNQVQYNRFQWRVLETEHFRVHYYKEEKAAVEDAARMAERSYARLSRILGHQFRERKPIVILEGTGLRGLQPSDAEVQQDRLLGPGVDPPILALGFSDAHLAPVEHPDRRLHGIGGLRAQGFRWV